MKLLLAVLIAFGSVFLSHPAVASANLIDSLNQINSALQDAAFQKSVQQCHDQGGTMQFEYFDRSTNTRMYNCVLPAPPVAPVQVNVIQSTPAPAITPTPEPIANFYMIGVHGVHVGPFSNANCQNALQESIGKGKNDDWKTYHCVEKILAAPVASVNAAEARELDVDAAAKSPELWWLRAPGSRVGQYEAQYSTGAGCLSAAAARQPATFYCLSALDALPAP